jgi:ferritin-like metal-binding protein YciE
MPRLDSLRHLLIDELQSLRAAEHQLTLALTNWIQAAADNELRLLLDQHVAQSQQNVRDVTQLLRQLRAPLLGHAAPALQQLLADVLEVAQSSGDLTTKEAALLVAMQKVKHQEIAGYGAARALAAVLGHDDVAEVLQDILDAKSSADDQLGDLVESIAFSASGGA